ncbi:sulfotransferase [Aestuariicoccus sp. MJ-SS9]|uniref:sulfotransferase n=1 Tax=Aestuariicoccus sp. MJ-SS9 TaxID=3079855 RepID=UPI002911B043|nr:sulfotransferase [Aestuariicoccus sp. MJ-SS9]MDU8909793.1 sulfotransferase [Aestuariicoccus sp. MJ-SS9]
MISYLHIGLPKCGSTFLQHRYFPVHPELYHLGKSRRPMEMPFDMRLFLFSDLTDLPPYQYDGAARRRMIDAHRDKAERRGARAIGISMELLTNMVQGRLSLDDRAARAVGALGSGTRVVFMVREPLSWMTSLYATYVREGGLTQGFDEWCVHAVLDRDIGFYANFLFDRIHDSYAALVGGDNILTLPYETLRASPQGAADAISDFLGVTRLPLGNEGALHARPSPLALGAMLALNRHWCFALGGPHLRRLGGHRLPELYAQEGAPVPGYVAEATKRHQLMYRPEADILACARQEGLEIAPPDLTCPPALQARLTESLAPHMRRLADLTGLPLAGLGYPV